MRTYLISISTLFLTFSIDAATVMVLKGNDQPFQRRILSGFSSSATEKITAFRYDEAKEGLIFSMIKKNSPDIIFTVGNIPTRKLAEAFPSTPLLVTQPMEELSKSPNLFVLDEDQPMKIALELAQALFPARKTIGTLYNPKLSQSLFSKLVSEAATFGIRVAALKVDTPQDAKSLINSLSGQIDLYFWIRDETTADPAVLQTLFSFTEKNNIPFFTSDPSQVEKGALLAIAYDPFRMGERAWEMAKTIMKDKKLPTALKEKFPLNVTLSLKTSAQFGLGSDTLYSFFQKTLKTSAKIELVP